MSKAKTTRRDKEYDFWSFPFANEKIFPCICSIFGGAERVRFNKTEAIILLPDSLAVKVPLSKLPDPENWTAFNLTELVHKEGLA